MYCVGCGVVPLVVVSNKGLCLACEHRERKARRNAGRLAKHSIKPSLDPCVYCGSTTKPRSIDHIQALVRGGKNDLSNVATACIECNQKKGEKPLFVFLQEAWGRAS